MNTQVLSHLTTDQYQIALQNYANLVEKTNNQLSFWLNVGNYLVAILGVMVAVIAIATAYAIWKNSEEQKRILREFVEKQAEILQKNRDEAQKNLDELITENKKKLEKASNEGKEKIQKVIDNLERDRALAGTQINPIVSFNSATGPLYSPTSVLTSSGIITGSSLASTAGQFLNNQVVCDSCGSFNSSLYYFCSVCGHKLHK